MAGVEYVIKVAGGDDVTVSAEAAIAIEEGLTASPSTTSRTTTTTYLFGENKGQPFHNLGQRKLIKLKETGETMSYYNRLRMVYVVRTDGDAYQTAIFGPFVNDDPNKLPAIVLLRFSENNIFADVDADDLTFVPVMLGDVEIPYLDGEEGD